MKRFLILIIAVCSLAACKKDGSPVSANIIGKWELHERRGGNIIPQDTIYQAGNGNILQFYADSTYKQYTNGTLSAQGVFHIIINGYRSGTDVYDELYFDNDVYFDYLISISGNSLILKPLMPDIGTTAYVRITN
ncbi:MAG TPA: hypothetical protein VHC47_09885 [Mucilaginibacter sp.]|nr:hypothetical protein [Mucilaginibacter sp.]